MNICKVDGCGKPVQAKGFCNKHYKRNQRLGDPIAPTREIRSEGRIDEIPCPICEKMFKPHIQHGEERRKYCSARCAQFSHYLGKSSDIFIVPCRICGEPLSQRSASSANICGDACRKEDARRKARELDEKKFYAKVKPFYCKECGKLHQPTYGEKKRDFCDSKCLVKYWRKVSKATRRAKIKGSKYESVNPLEILRRDGWTCQACGSSTPRKHRGTIRDDAPEVDHIQPLAVGGSHTRDNLQCLCRRCNQEKGAAWDSTANPQGVCPQNT